MLVPIVFPLAIDLTLTMFCFPSRANDDVDDLEKFVISASVGTEKAKFTDEDEYLRRYQALQREIAHAKLDW